MARAKRSAPNYSSENLPVIIPDRESLPLWCTLIYSAFLHSLVKIFLLRKDLDDSKVKLRDYESLLTQCADFLNTTSNNSNWPSSVTASPIMDRGRHLLISIRTALGIDDKNRKERGQQAKKVRMKQIVLINLIPLQRKENHASLTILVPAEKYYHLT